MYLCIVIKTQNTMKPKLTKTDQKLIDSLVFNFNGKDETIRNPFSGETCKLEPRGVALHDYIKGCEATKLYDNLRKGLTLFRKLYPEQYYVLLD